MSTKLNIGLTIWKRSHYISFILISNNLPSLDQASPISVGLDVGATKGTDSVDGNHISWPDVKLIQVYS